MKAGLLLIPFLIYAAFILGLGGQDNSEDGLRTPVQSLLKTARATNDQAADGINRIHNTLPQMESLIQYTLQENNKKTHTITGENAMNDGLTPDQLVGPHLVYTP